MEFRLNVIELVARLTIAVVLCALWSGVAPRVAHAQADDAKARAEALFQQGRQLLAEGELDQACTRFDASQELDPHTATLLNLAHCHERAGSITAAWLAYRAAATLARKQGRQDRLETAMTRSASLAKGKARVKIIVTEPIPTPAVTLDTLILSADALGEGIPVELGTHVISARADGKLDWSRDLAVDHVQDLEVRIPALVDAPPRAAPPPTAAPAAPLPAAPLPAAPLGEPSWFSTQRTVGIVTMAVGAAAVGVGAVLGAVTLSMTSDIDAQCPTRDACTAMGIALNDEARDLATGSTVMFIAGGVLLAAGLAITLTGEDEPQSAAEPAVQLTPMGLSMQW